MDFESTQFSLDQWTPPTLKQFESPASCIGLDTQTFFLLSFLEELISGIIHSAFLNKYHGYTRSGAPFVVASI
jgi:hypothetical protein